MTPIDIIQQANAEIVTARAELEGFDETWKLYRLNAIKSRIRAAQDRQLAALVELAGA